MDFKEAFMQAITRPFAIAICDQCPIRILLVTILKTGEIRSLTFPFKRNPWAQIVTK